MKSIKEKAFELFPEMQTDSNDWDVIEEQCDRDAQRKAFVNGANYVLEEIEEFQKLFSACMNAHANGYLKSVIEQLKK